MIIDHKKILVPSLGLLLRDRLPVLEVAGDPLALAGIHGVTDIIIES